MATQGRKWITLASLVWPFEHQCSDSVAHEIACQQFEELIGKHIPKEVRDKIEIKIKANRCAERVSKMARVGGLYKPQEILALRTDHKGLRFRGAQPEEEFHTFVGYNDEKLTVSMVSDRYHVFGRDACVCQACGLPGTEMYLEQNRGSKEGRAHFNLYGYEEDGKMTIFTKDHILASSQGGPTHMDNLQTYCAICNLLKGKHRATNEQVAELRRIYNKNKGTGKLIVAIKEAKIGIGQDKKYGANKAHVQAAKKLATAAKLKLTVSVMVVNHLNKDGVKIGYNVHEWARLRHKTLKKFEAENDTVLIPAGTVLQVNRTSGTNIICFYHINEEEPLKLPINYLLLENISSDHEEPDPVG